MPIGFLEESKGVKSMSRLTVLWMSVLATAIVGTGCYCALTGKPLAEAAWVALAGMLVTVVAKGAVAIVNRSAADAEK